ncbi:MAG: Appr-1-p processing protein [Deltaproteobacteria bacterium CG07_land_8_20_14_0_80_60_11]|nr:MAG: Appr-1-p processing protein [Deltaproteobacteria bacterium CG07_land_8_20_14_0_80_60_11]
MADIKELYSSLFDSTCQTLVNTVNCVGVMGRGLALEFKRRFPDMYSFYRSQCERRLLRPGKLLLYKESTPWILNFPTKDHWKYPSKILYIESGLSEFANTYYKIGITSIAFPELGTSSGKLGWNEVRRIMYKYLEPLKNLQIEIYHFNQYTKDTFEDKLYQKIHRFEIDDYIREIGLKRREAKLIYEAFTSGSISKLRDLQSIKGVGEKTIKAIYNYMHKPVERIITLSERQPTLF